MSAVSKTLLLAFCVPIVVAYDALPIVGVVQQLMVVSLWGGVLIALEAEATKNCRLDFTGQIVVGSAALLATLAFVQSHSLSGSLDQGLLAGFAISSFALVCWRISAASGAFRLRMDAFFAAIVCAGVINAFVIFIQVFLPKSTDGLWVAHSLQNGIGNLRQPNLSALLEVWAVASLAALQAKGRLNLRLIFPTAAILIAALVLTASRMGMLACLLLGFWAVLDRSLYRGVRRFLCISALLLVGIWGCLEIWSHFKAEELLLTQRVMQGSSSGRFQLWHDVLLILKDNWLWGVGWGEFNFVWTLTSKSGVQHHYFDNAHNIVLHLATELGIPVAFLIAIVFFTFVKKARMNIQAASGFDSIDRQVAFLMLATVIWHSLFEYPLWRMYFLVPTAVLVAVVLRPLKLEYRSGRSVHAAGYLAGFAMLGAAVFGSFQYKVIADLQLLGGRRNSLEWHEQLKFARNSLLFSWVGYRATAIGMKNDPMGVRVAEYAAHGAIDVALLVAWADALRAAGELDRARFIAARISEFAKPESERFLAVCKKQGFLSAAQLEEFRFRCEAPSMVLTYRDFR